MPHFTRYVTTVPLPRAFVCVTDYLHVTAACYGPRWFYVCRATFCLGTFTLPTLGRCAFTLPLCCVVTLLRGLRLRVPPDLLRFRSLPATDSHTTLLFANVVAVWNTLPVLGYGYSFVDITVVYYILVPLRLVLLLLLTPGWYALRLPACWVFLCVIYCCYSLHYIVAIY